MEIHGDDEIIPKTGKKWTRFEILGALLAREYELRRNKEVKARDSITDNNVGKGTELKGSRLRSREISMAKRSRSCRRKRTDFATLIAQLPFPSLAPPQIDDDNEQMGGTEEVPPPPPPPPQLPPAEVVLIEPPPWIVNEMIRLNGNEPKKILQKRLRKSDIDRAQSRLLIPFLQIVEKDFLREEEKREIDEQYARSKIKVNGKRVWTKKIDTAFTVIMVDPITSRQWNLVLGRWNMSKERGATSNYALQVSWNSVVQDKELVTGDVIELWSFRVGGRLYLAIFTHREIFPLN